MRRFLLFCGLLLATIRAFAQDVILQTNGTEIPGKVILITPEQITYISAAEGRSDTLQLASSAVFLIRYANGTKEVLHNPAAPTGPSMSKEEAYTQGQLDARKYFRARGAFWGTFGATFVTAPAFGVGGIATGAAVAASPPKTANLIVPDRQLLQNASYVEGYRKQAQRRKLGSAAGGFGAALGTQLVLSAIIILVLFKDGFS